jgi:hypothetical protein
LCALLAVGVAPRTGQTAPGPQIRSREEVLRAVGQKGVINEDTRSAMASRPADALKFDSTVGRIVPEVVFNWLEDNGWGFAHALWHATRDYYAAGETARRWLRASDIPPCELQGGMPYSGVDFLAMHGSMIGVLRDEIGHVPLVGDPEYKTMGDLLTGWDTDAKLRAGLTAIKVSSEMMSAIEDELKAANDFRCFESEDDYGRFLQANWIFVKEGGSTNAVAKLLQGHDLAGVHADLHGAIRATDPDATKQLLDLGDPRKNLGHIFFWRLHGWIQAKWQQYLKAKPRSAEDTTLYEAFRGMYAKHHAAMVCTPLRSDALMSTLPKVLPPRVAPRTTGGCAPPLAKKTLRDRLLGVASGFTAALGRLRNAISTVGNPVKAANLARAVAVLVNVPSKAKMPNNVADDFAVVAFVKLRNIPCQRLARGVTSPNCPQGPDTLVRVVGSAVAAPPRLAAAAQGTCPLYIPTPATTGAS